MPVADLGFGGHSLNADFAEKTAPACKPAKWYGLPVADGGLIRLQRLTSVAKRGVCNCDGGGGVGPDNVYAWMIAANQRGPYRYRARMAGIPPRAIRNSLDNLTYSARVFISVCIARARKAGPRIGVGKPDR